MRCGQAAFSQAGQALGVGTNMCRDPRCRCLRTGTSPQIHVHLWITPCLLKSYQQVCDQLPAQPIPFAAGGPSGPDPQPCPERTAMWCSQCGSGRFWRPGGCTWSSRQPGAATRNSSGALASSAGCCALNLRFWIGREPPVSATMPSAPLPGRIGADARVAPFVVRLAGRVMRSSCSRPKAPDRAGRPRVHAISWVQSSAAGGRVWWPVPRPCNSADKPLHRLTKRHRSWPGLSHPAGKMPGCDRAGQALA